jgi:hypothetical protein
MNCLATLRALVTKQDSGSDADSAPGECTVDARADATRSMLAERKDRSLDRGTPVACDHNVALQRARFRHSFKTVRSELVNA